MKGIVIGLSLIYVVFILCCFLHKRNEEKEQEDKEKEDKAMKFKRRSKKARTTKVLKHS